MVKEDQVTKGLESKLEELRNLMSRVGNGKTGEKKPGSNLHFRQITESLVPRINRREIILEAERWFTGAYSNT